MRRDFTAQLIYEDLRKHGDSHGDMIRYRTGLSPMQFQYGKGFLQDEIQTDKGQPLVWSPRRGVYSLTTDEGEWRAYLIGWRMKSVQTQLRRIEQTAIAGGMMFGTRKQQIRLLIAAISAARSFADNVQ